MEYHAVRRRLVWPLRPLRMRKNWRELAAASNIRDKRMMLRDMIIDNRLMRTRPQYRRPS